MKRIELDGLKSWVWERAGAASFRYLADIAREEERSLDDLVLLGASRHPALPELLAQLGEDPRERHDDWSEYFRRYRVLGLRALWSDEPGESPADAETTPSGGAASPAAGQAVGLMRSALGLLKTPDDPLPPALYFRGDPALLVRSRRLGVCGTRSITGEGAQNARTLARRAVAEGWVGLHGAARGADEVFGRAAARLGGTQVFILGEGTGHALVEHPLREFFDGSLVVSVRPPFTAPHRGSLIQRNRLIAALSEALVVIQTGPNGGSWYNIRAAREFGHPVLTFERELGSTRAEETVSGSTTTAGGATLLSEEDLAEGRRRLIALGARRLTAHALVTCPSDVLAQRMFDGRHFDPADHLAELMSRLAQQGSLFEPE